MNRDPVNYTVCHFLRKLRNNIVKAFQTPALEIFWMCVIRRIDMTSAEISAWTKKPHRSTYRHTGMNYSNAEGMQYKGMCAGLRKIANIFCHFMLHTILTDHGGSQVTLMEGSYDLSTSLEWYFLFKFNTMAVVILRQLLNTEFQSTAVSHQAWAAQITSTVFQCSHPSLCPVIMLPI